MIERGMRCLAWPDLEVRTQSSDSAADAQQHTRPLCRKAHNWQSIRGKPAQDDMNKGMMRQDLTESKICWSVGLGEIDEGFDRIRKIEDLQSTDSCR
jgi:hypothetical protein